ncbi:hypothetical protein F2Q69_00060466 [Brassica cretica]|uniref:Uncharacterized protein n=1 Tax=Brassica cretica TaxID=69181 RepID=A0A8S9RR73_BRACR|nr:hypothetical protein F2Q69_00060466 [Brassica cretica]
MVEGKEMSEFQTMWRIKQQDLAMKQKLSKMKLLDSLIAKQEPLADYEEALKKKLINEFLSNYMKSKWSRRLKNCSLLYMFSSISLFQDMYMF